MEFPKHPSFQFNPNLPKNETLFNRLIITGNGFDIAHGLKTGFKDFIYSYCLEVIQKLIQHSYFEDIILKINTNGSFIDLPAYNKTMTPELAFNLITNPQSGIFSVKIKSEFFRLITIDIINKNWVDIELIYYQNLKNHIKNKSTDYIPKLNQEFDFLKQHLIKYLKQQEDNTQIHISEKIISQFTEEIKIKETKKQMEFDDNFPQQTCILNFNYTNIASKYATGIINKNFQYIPIHGILNNTENIENSEIIFGFGDEMDSEYLNIESIGNNEILANIKSFKYLLKNYYQNLSSFIESDYFQVQIYGHSCGLSDRTLLNTIFEHENCISIKQFYYQQDGKDDFETRSYSISRHFKSKADLRSKVVNKQFCRPMAQPINEISTP